MKGRGAVVHVACYQLKNTRTRAFASPGVSYLLRDHTVGLTGFEPAASSSRTKRATKLRHSPIAKRQETAHTSRWSIPERPGAFAIA
jgi:hypothetical protein